VKAVQQSIKPGKASKPRASAASPKNAFSWILLADALALTTDAYQNSMLAQRKLCKAFVESQVRTRAACAESGWIREPGQKQWKEYEHNLQLSDLWRREYFGPSWMPYSKLQIHWQDSSATVETDVAQITVTFYRIEVAREDVSKLLPEGYEPRIPPALPATSSTAEPHPGGAPREYSHEQILIEAAAYIVVNNLPETQTKLRDEIALILDNRSPGDTLLGEILRPLYKRIAEVLAANR
jgi:hypothetical protein